MPASNLETKIAGGRFAGEVLDTISDGVMIVDRELKILYWNRGAASITGFDRPTCLGTAYGRYMTHVDEEGKPFGGLFDPLELVLGNGRSQNCQLYVLHKAGYVVPVNATIDSVTEGDTVVGAIEIFREAKYFDDLEKTHRRIMELNRNDELTGIANRRHLMILLEEEISRSRRTNRPLSGVIMDIDRFSTVNGKFGHVEGDKVLTEFAQSLSRLIRVTDRVGRFSAKYFMVLLPDCNIANAMMVAEKWRQTLSEESFLDGAVKLTVSGGVSEYRPGESITGWIERMEGGALKSKREGRNRITAADNYEPVLSV